MSASGSDFHSVVAKRSTRFQRGVLWLALSAMIVQPVSVSAQIVASVGAYAPGVESAANGVPLIQVNTPSAAGVSRNQYQQYNVGTPGVVLNNSALIVPTQLAGFVAGNPNLAAGSARIIVNEVTSALPSRLRGYSEVAGARADVIIANPNGITCDGCGFINTRRGVLTTGAPVFGADGRLDGLRVSGGQITIDAGGLNAAAIEQVDLIARAVQVNGEIWGQALNVVAGAHQVSYADLGVEAVASSGAPAVSIDVGQLGGMYAGKIRLVSSEAGVGVASAGTLAAQAGDLAIDSAGRIILRGNTQASGRIDLVARQAIDTSGRLYAEHDVTLTSGGLLNNSGSLIAQRQLDLVAASIASSGTLAAGADAQGKQAGAGGALLLSATAGDINLGGGVVHSGGDLRLSAAGAIANVDGRISAGQDVNIASSGAFDNRHGRLEAAQKLALAASGVSNTDGRVIGQDLRVDSRQQALVNTGGQIVASGTLAIDSGALANEGGLIQASGALTIDTHGQTLRNTQSAAQGILGERGVTLAAGDIDNRGGAIAALGAQDLDLTVSGRVDNGDGGRLVAGRTLRLAAFEASNVQGLMAAGGDVNVSVAHALDNRGGRVWAAQDLALSADHVANSGGRLYAARDFDLSADGLVGDGILLADRDLTIALGGAYTQSPANSIAANRDLRLALAGGFVNQGTLAAVGRLDVAAASIDNQSGATLQAASASLAASTSFNNSGAIWADSLRLSADALSNTGSVFGQDVTLAARTLSNEGPGVIAAGHALNLYIGSALRNVDGGLLYSSGTLSIAADASCDGGGWLANPTAYVLNSSASIEARGDLELTATLVDNRRSSAITATRTVSSATTLVEEKDDGWSAASNGFVFVNSSQLRIDTTTTTCNMQGENCLSSTSSALQSVAAHRDVDVLGMVTSGPTKVCSPTCQMVTTTTTTVAENPYGTEVWGPGGVAAQTYTLLDDANRVPYERRRVVRSEHLQDYVVAATPEARLLAGGKLDLRAGTVNNSASRIEASGRLSAAVDTLNNTGVTLSERTHDTIWHGGCVDIQGYRPGILGACQSGWLWTVDVSDTLLGNSGSLDAVFSGGQALTLSAITVNNRTVDAQGLPPGGINLSAAGGVRINATSSAPYVFSVARGGLFTVHGAPGAPYLVETDPRFTQYSSFVSSDYLLGRLGLDPAAVQKRLGDGYYEQQLVREQIINRRGQASLGAYASLDAEYRALLDAGAAYARAFSIAPGVTLTQAQIAGVAHDLVWLEARVVDGEDVLVPVVYLAQNTRATPGPGGAVIGGGVSTRIDAVDVSNSGALVASGSTRVVASHDLVSDSGTIGGPSVVLAAGNDLHLGTATRSVRIAAGQTFTHQGLAGTVEGQRVSLSAGRDLTLAGGLIRAGDATLRAGRDLTIGTQSVSSEQRAAAGGSRYERSASAPLGSVIVTGGELTLMANNDLTVAGSRLKSGGELNATAGNNLLLSAARTTEQVDYDAHHAAIDATLHSAVSSAQTSTLEAGGMLSLAAGATLASEGALLRAGDDIALAASRTVLDAAYDSEQRRQSYSNVGQRGQQQMQSELSSQRARGTIVAAGGDLTITSGGDTTVVGGALAAGRSLTLDTGGELALLAAQSRSATRLDASGSDRRKATTLHYSDEQTRQLLTTLAAGVGLALAVGGDFTAEVGERNADGTLRADRMTVDGLVTGDSRQQVAVTRTGVGANANPTSSPVRGELARQGIRNGATDAFTPGATQRGGAALEQYLASGLVQVKNEPVVAGELKRILQSDGATLSTREASGKVSLTVAGQAKVRDVYNTLKLSETFAEKHFANAGVAQAVTLVAAITLTVMSSGAGATSIGATLAGGAGTSATMINAALVAMASTMTGQLAGGARFDDAFAAGIKAAATSAMTAGILNAPLIDGGAQGMQSINQLANVQTTGANIVGKFSADTLGQNLAGMAVRGVVNAGVNSAIYSGSFGESFKSSFVSDLAAVGANAVGLSTDTQSPGNVLGHAAVGAVAARLKGLDAASGAIGGATSALVNPLLDQAIGGSDGGGWGSDPQTAQQWQSATLQLASIGVSAGIASALGKDGMTAATAAQNETVNNFLTRNGIGTVTRACAGSNNPTACQTQVAQQLNTSVAQKAANCRVQGTCKELAQQIGDGATAITQSEANGTLTKVAADALMAKQIQDLDTVLAAANLPKTDQTAVKALVGAGLAAPLIVACVMDLPMCGAVLVNAALRVAANPATPEVAAGVLCAASRTACPLSVTGVSGTASTVTKTAATAASGEIKVGTAGTANGVAGVGSIGRDFFDQAAQGATHNPNASEVVLGRYIAGSPNSYEMVAQTRGATYFSMNNWSSVSQQVGSDKMWGINQAFLEQQIVQGKSFIFTGNPYSAPVGSYTAQELGFLLNKGYRVVPETGGIYRAVKK